MTNQQKMQKCELVYPTSTATSAPRCRRLASDCSWGIAIYLGLLWGSVVCAAEAPQAQSTAAALTGIYSKFSPGTNELTVAFEGRDRVLEFAVADQSQRQLVQRARPGDSVTLVVDDAVEPVKVTRITALQRPVGKEERLISFGIAFLVVLGAAAIAARSSPLRFAVGVDNRYSNSQVQLVAWSGALAMTYLASVALRAWLLGADFIGGVGVTANLVALTGMSALSFGGAKVITAGKVEKQALVGGVPKTTSNVPPNLLRDLFTNDQGVPDLGDFQMIAITLVAAAIFVVTSFHWLHLLTVSTTVTLPDIDSSLLAGFGLGQGAYLVKKAALKLGEG